MKYFLLVLSLFAFSSMQGAVIVGGVTFDDNAFVDSLISSTGSFSGSDGSVSVPVQTAITDTDPGTFITCAAVPASLCPSNSLTLGFTNNFLINGPGDDLAIFEIGFIEDSFSLTLNGVTRQYMTANVGAVPSGLDLNLALVNLDDFGIPAGTALSQLILQPVLTGQSSPSFSLVGAVNSSASAVPEPATVGLTGAAGVVLAVLRRRFGSWS